MTDRCRMTLFAEPPVIVYPLGDIVVFFNGTVTGYGVAVYDRTTLALISKNALTSKPNTPAITGEFYPGFMIGNVGYVKSGGSGYDGYNVDTGAFVGNLAITNNRHYETENYLYSLESTNTIRQTAKVGLAETTALITGYTVLATYNILFGQTLGWGFLDNDPSTNALRLIGSNPMAPAPAGFYDVGAAIVGDSLTKNQSRVNKNLKLCSLTGFYGAYFVDLTAEGAGNCTLTTLRTQVQLESDTSSVDFDNYTCATDGDDFYICNVQANAGECMFARYTEDGVYIDQSPNVVSDDQIMTQNLMFKWE